MKCQDLVRLSPTSPFITRCCAPVIWPASGAIQHRCLAHSLQPSTIVANPTLQVLEAIQIDGATYYIQPDESGPIFAANGDVKGAYDADENTVEFYEVS